MNESDFEAAERDASLRVSETIRSISKKVPEPGKLGPEECHCGSEIPMARRKGGYSECVECAMEKEVTAKRYATR